VNGSVELGKRVGTVDRTTIADPSPQHANQREAKMRFSFPAVGIVFDLDVVGNGYHAMELFMKHTDPKQLAGCIVASGDVQRP